MWYHDNSWVVGVKHIHPVGTKLPNPWGLYDMHGNVFEWVPDWWGYYPGNPQVDPTGPASGSYRVIRGGGFGNLDVHTRSAVRYGLMSPDARHDDIGIRAVRIGSGDVVIGPNTWGQIKILLK